jgi:hypothetical protein
LPSTRDDPAVMDRMTRAADEAWATLEEVLARVPPAVLLAAPAVLLAAVAIALPEPVRLGFTIDLDLYRRYGLEILAGQTPYRQVPVEYPPLALVPMLLPLLGAAPPATVDLATYTWRFVALAAALAVAVGGLLWWATGSRRTLALWTALVGLSWVAAIFRYDLWPSLALLSGVLLAGGRPGSAGLALGAGTMLKLFPATALPILAGAAIVERDRYGATRLVAGFGLVILLVAGWAWLVAGPASLDWLRYQEDRGLQIESVGASILLALHVLAGLPVDWNDEFGAMQVVAAGSRELVTIAPWIEALLLAIVVGLAVRRFRLDERGLGRVPLQSMVLASLAALAAPLLGSKVLSMQYVLWLLPLVPFLGLRIAILGLLLAGTTTAVYTAVYEGLWHFAPPAIGLLVVRNVILAVFVGVLLRALWTGAGSGAGSNAGSDPA